MIILLLFFFSFTVLQTQQSDPFSFSNHSIAMILDSQEFWSKNSSPLTAQEEQSHISTRALLQSFKSKSFPIITTKKLFFLVRLFQLIAEYAQNRDKNVGDQIDEIIISTYEKKILPSMHFNKNIFHDFLESVKKSIEIVELYKENPTNNNKKQFIELLSSYHHIIYILAAKFNFNPQEWLIKDIGSNLILVVPKHIYADDKQMGLAISNYKDISKLPLLDLYKESITNENNITKTIQECFIHKKNYKNSNEAPTWTIYIEGHGDTETKKFAMLKPDQLKDLIQNLNDILFLKLFVINACSLAEDVTKYLENILRTSSSKQLQTIFSILAFGGIIETLTSVINPATFDEIVDHSKSTIKINVSSSDYGSFFNDLKAHTPIQFDTTLNKVFVYQDSKGVFHPENVPLLRFPSNEFFTPLQIKNHIASIGQTFAMTHDPKKSLSVNTFFKKGLSGQCNNLPNLLLLYTANIPFPLEFKNCGSSTFPLFIKMTNAPGVHLNSLILENFDALEALEHQFQLIEKDTIYFIDSILIKDLDPLNPEVFILEPLYEKVLIVKTSNAFFNLEDGIYLTLSDGQPIRFFMKDNKWQQKKFKKDLYKNALEKFKHETVTDSRLSEQNIEEIKKALEKKLHQKNVA